MIALLSPRERKILLFTLGVAAFALGYHFLLDPFFKAWRDVSTEIQLARAHLQKTQHLLRKEKEIKETFIHYAPFSLEGDTEEVVTGILQEVEGLAQKHHLKVLEMRPLPKKQIEFFKEQGLEVSAEGTAPQFAKFIYSLLDSPNPLKIEKLELRSKSGKDPNLKALIVVTTLTK